MTVTMEELNEAVIYGALEYYTMSRQLPDGRWCGVMRLLFHWTVHIDIHAYGYEDRYCFAEFADACNAMMDWDGTGDMPGAWHRHPTSGRRRDPATGKEWVEA